MSRKIMIAIIAAGTAAVTAACIVCRNRMKKSD